MTVDTLETHTIAQHQHGPGCGHEAIQRDGHLDYVHDGHRHALHEDHYDVHDDRV